MTSRKADTVADHNPQLGPLDESQLIKKRCLSSRPILYRHKINKAEVTVQITNSKRSQAFNHNITPAANRKGKLTQTNETQKSKVTRSHIQKAQT